ncbi:hypothetical protein FQN50_006755, partial [Emmonsiellopsis sp. PD_5]
MANEGTTVPSNGTATSKMANNNGLCASQMRTIAQMIQKTLCTTLTELSVGSQNGDPDNACQSMPDHPGTFNHNMSPAVTNQTQNSSGNFADYTQYMGNASWKITDISIFWLDSPGSNDIWDKD